MDARLLIDTCVLLLYFFVIVVWGSGPGRRNDNLAGFLARRPVDSMVGGAGLDHRGGDERRHLSRHAGGGVQDARLFLRPARHRHDPRPHHHRFTFIKPYYDYRVQSVYEFLTVRFGTKTKNMASGIFLFTRVLGIGVRLYLGGAIMVVIWRYSVSRPAGQSQHLRLGHHLRNRHHDDLHGCRWNQGGGLDRSDPGDADAQLGGARDFSAHPQHSRWAAQR